MKTPFQALQDRWKSITNSAARERVPPASTSWIGDDGAASMPKLVAEPWPGPYTLEMCAAAQDRISSQGEEPELVLDEDQSRALNLVLQGRNVFVTGQAGTGKTALIRAIRRVLYAKRSGDSHGVAVTASTGIAANNIGGCTLHSYAGMGWRCESAAALAAHISGRPWLSKQWRETEVLVVDEVSMIDGVTLDRLSDAVAEVRGQPNSPFGGIQLVFLGDFYQLPPVNKEDRRLAKLAFQSLMWERAFKHVVVLKRFHRQHDPRLIHILSCLRTGNLTEEAEHDLKLLERTVEYPDGLLPTELYCRRADVKSANDSRLGNLRGPRVTYVGIDSADIPDDLESLQVPFVLSLKIGAEVLYVRNRSDGSGLVNGSRGRIVAFLKTSDWPRLEGKYSTSSPMKLLTSHEYNGLLLKNGRNLLYPVVEFVATPNAPRFQHLVLPEMFHSSDYSYTQARRFQIPLILSHALTIHKAQGLTLDRVRVDLGNSFEYGQPYVAGTRATTAAGLQIVNWDGNLIAPHPALKQLRLEDSDEPEEAGLSELDSRQS